MWVQTQPDLKQPVKVEGDARMDKILFNQYCVTCRGPRGRGDGLEIARATVANPSSPTTQRILNVDLPMSIRERRPGKVMPSWEYELSKGQSNEHTGVHSYVEAEMRFPRTTVPL